MCRNFIRTDKYNGGKELLRYAWEYHILYT